MHLKNKNKNIPEKYQNLKMKLYICKVDAISVFPQ